MKQNMKKGLFLASVASVIVLGVLPFGLTHPGSSIFPGIQAPRADKPGPPGAGFGRVPLQFIPNEGQAAPGIDFYIQGRDKIVSFSEEGLTFVLDGRSSVPWAVKIGFLGSRPGVKPAGTERSGAVVSYLKGPRDERRAGLPAYSKIAYRDLWPGIDLVCSGSNDRLKYEFVVRPGADPGRVGLVCRGASDIRLTSAGRLDFITPAGSFQDDAPAAYQEEAGIRAEVPAAYLLEEAGIVHFRLGHYDRGRTLVIDPAILVSCGFAGGSGSDEAHAVATDPQGNVYIAGGTSSLDLAFPLGAGPNPAYGGGASDAFVAKLDPEGTALIYCCYLGGSGADRASGLAVDPDGNAYVAGTTSSPETSFPVTLGPDLTYNGGASDGFVAKLNPDGASLAFCGYVGGEGEDEINASALGFAGFAETYGPRIYVAGSTSSTESTFPVAVGPDLTYNGGESDAFVAALKGDGTAIEKCGYIGGAGRDVATAMAAVFYWLGDPSIYVAGRTSSTEMTFPVLTGPDLSYNGGEFDAFVAGVCGDWTSLNFCGYIGGAGSDVVTALRADVYGEGGSFPFPISTRIAVAGSTSSTEATFPVLGGPGLTYNGGGSDGFVASVKVEWFTSPPVILSSCGYIGGDGSDEASALITHATGLYVAGRTSSPESTFPVAFGADMTYNGGASDAFLAKLAPDPATIGSCGYLGGAGADRAEALAFGKDGDVLIAGSTGSTETSFPVIGGPDLSFKGGASDAFLARVHMKGPTLSSLSKTSAIAGDPGFTLTVTGADFMDGARVRWTGDPLPTTFVSETELRASVEAGNLSTSACYYVTVENPDREASGSLGFTVKRGPLTLTSLSPARAAAGSGACTLTLSGSGFYLAPSPDGVSFLSPQVSWNGTMKDSRFLSETELQISLSRGDIAVPGEVQVFVANPPPSGGDSNPLVFTVCGFTMAPAAGAATVPPGGSAKYVMRLAPRFGSFDSPVSFTCSDLPKYCTASFSPGSLTPGAGAAETVLTLATLVSAADAAGALLGPAGGRPPGPSWLPVVLLFLLTCLALRRQGRPARPRLLAGAALVVLALLLSGCGSANLQLQKRTPPGTYQITVNATSGSYTVTSAVELVVR